MKTVFKAALLLVFLIAFPVAFSLSLGNGSASGIVNTATIPTNLNGTELSDIVEATGNTSTISTSMPGSSWTLKDVSLNFSGIVLGKEDKAVVSASNNRREMSKFVTQFGYAVEVMLTEPTIIYGAYVPVAISATLAVVLYLRLQGCDNANNRPNATIYSAAQLNATTTVGWRFHSFGASSLQAGRYFLTLDASPINLGSQRVFWNYSSIINGLYTSEYTASWQPGSNVIAPMAYHLTQKASKVFHPSDLAMQVNINGTNHPVVDGSTIGSGNLSVTGLSWVNPGTIVSFPVSINRSATPFFNVTCGVKIERSMVCGGYVTSTLGSSNLWTFETVFNRTGTNYTIGLLIAPGWYYARLYRDSVDITNESFRKGNVFYVQNSSITTGSSWLFTAQSPSIPFIVSFPKTAFNPGQVFSISATPPAYSGQFTFTLYNALGGVVQKETRAHGPATESFTLTLNQNAPEGEGSVVLAWHNATDAGIKSITYTVAIPPSTDLITITIIVAAIVSGAFIIAISLYSMIRRTRRRIEADRLDIINKASDLFNLNYIIILDKQSGIDIFGQTFGEFSLDPTLVSGFLSAIGTFGLELTNTDEDSQTIKLEYKKSKIVILEFKGFRITLIMKDAPSHSMISSLDKLAHDIDEKYGKILKAFNGETTAFQDMGTLIEKHLHVSFIAPLKISPRQKVDLTQDEKDIYNKATDVSMAKKMNPFFASEILAGDKIEPKAVSAFFSLMDKGIITPAK